MNLKSSNAACLFFYLLVLFALSLTKGVNAQTVDYQNASDLANSEPLAGFSEIRTSQEIYLLWAQDDFLKNQIVDYFPTAQPEASLLAGPITDVFAPSQVKSGLNVNETTRTAVTAADLDNNGVDEIIKASTTDDFDLLLTVTEVGSELEVTGSSITQQIDALVARGVKLGVRLIKGNFDSDVNDEFILIWAEGEHEIADGLKIQVFDQDEGRIETLAHYDYDRSLHSFDVVVSDLDLNGQHEIALSTLEENSQTFIVSTTVLSKEGNELIEKTNLVIDEFSEQFPIADEMSISLTQGDFDGDVAPELALIFRQAYDDLGGQRLQMRILQAVDVVNGGDENVFEQLLVANNLSLQDTIVPNPFTYEKVLVASGDLNGNGNDELAILLPRRQQLMVLPLNTLSDENHMSSSLVGGSNDDPIFCFTRGGSQALRIEIADLNRDGIDELVYVEAEGCTDDIYSENLGGARLTIDVYDLATGVANLTGSVNINESNTQYFGVLAADFVLGDFNGDNFRLGQGKYFRKSELSQPLIILNAPPVHFDLLNGEPFDINRCYGGTQCNFASTYFRSTSMSAETSTTISSAWSLSATVTGSVSADAVFVKSSVEASVTAKYGEKFSNYRRSGERIEIATQVSAIEDDQIYATVTDYDIWEYPIYEGDSIVAHLLSVTPTIIERRWFPSKSYNAFDYLPDHEVGNILSYRERKPTLNNIAQNITSDEFTLSENSLNKWTVNQRSFTESGSSFEQEIELEASVTVETEAQFKVFGGSLSATVEGEYEASELSTHRTKVSQELEIEVELGGVDESLGEVKYAVQPYCYWAKNGALVVDYTTQPEVPAPGASDTWWSANYGQNADPALILPWRHDPEKGLTLQDEQVKRFQSKSITFSNARPAPGDTITIFVEIHNWSLLPTANPVEVGFYLCDPTLEENRITGINGGNTISTGSVLEPRGNEILSFKWEVPAGLPTFPRIYARLDPDNREAEIHEENNFGFNILNISTNRAPCPPPMITNTRDRDLEVRNDVIKIFPNPVQGNMHIEFQADWPQDFEFEIVDALGRKLRHYEGDHIGQRHTISLQGFQDGLYYYRLFFDGKVVTGTFLKE